MYIKFHHVACPDNITRTAIVSERQLRRFGEILAATNEPSPLRARVQANGLSVWGTLTYDRQLGGWRFTANSPAFLSRYGRALAAQLLGDVAARCLMACRPMRDCRAAHDAALRRAARLLGVRGLSPSPRKLLPPGLYASGALRIAA